MSRRLVVTLLRTPRSKATPREGDTMGRLRLRQPAYYYNYLVDLSVVRAAVEERRHATSRIDADLTLLWHKNRTAGALVLRSLIVQYTPRMSTNHPHLRPHHSLLLPRPIPEYFLHLSCSARTSVLLVSRPTSAIGHLQRGLLPCAVLSVICTQDLVITSSTAWRS